MLLAVGCGGGSPSPESTGSHKIQGGTTSAAGVVDDEIVLPNDRSQYRILSTASGYTIKSIPDDGNVQNYPILRRVQFADSSLALDVDESSTVYRLYQAAFNRKPDLAGLGYWFGILDAGSTLEQIAEAFINSKEFRDLYATSTTNQQFLTTLYNNVLHRTPDAAGLVFWLGAFQRGATKTAVLVEFSESPENRAATAAAVQDGIAYAQMGVKYRPVAAVAPKTDALAGTAVKLDGGASTDANGDKLTFAWLLDAKPAASKTLLNISSLSTLTFTPDIAGTYSLSLRVNDGNLGSRPASAIVTVSAVNIPVQIPDSGIYTCSQLSPAQAAALYAAGHGYLDRDHDGKPCEANDIAIEIKNVTPSPPSTGKRCWVNGYTRKNGTHVNGYWRSC
jgi:hypothetical protein